MAEGGLDISQTCVESVTCYGDGIDLSTSNWKKRSVIGVGTFSVYDVELLDGRFPNKLAVKEIKICSIDTKNVKKNIESEKTILKRLKHKRIVPLYSMHEYNSVLYIFMEKCSRGTLADYINEKTFLDEDTTRKFTFQILEGVSYLHKQKCIHRDIKGANILLESDLSIRLADFGISKLLIDLTSASTTNIGTCNWTAPEMFLGPKYKENVDIWSVGCTVVQMLTGKPPFYGLQPAQIITKHVMNEDPIYQLPLSSSKEVKWFLASTLEKDPSKRPPADVLLTSAFIIGTTTDRNSSEEDIECDASSGVPNQGNDPGFSFNEGNSNRPIIMNLNNCNIGNIESIKECNIHVPRVSDPPQNDRNKRTNTTKTEINIKKAEIVSIDSVVNKVYSNTETTV